MSKSTEISAPLQVFLNLNGPELWKASRFLFAVKL